MVLLLLRSQINAAMALDIDCQLGILVSRHARLLDQMNMHDALLPSISFDEEAELQMLGAPLVRLLGAGKEAIPGMSRPAVLAVRSDLRRVAEQLLALTGDAVALCANYGTETLPRNPR